MSIERERTKILVVEDEADFAAYVETALTAQGYAVRVARDGEEGLALVRREKPDLVTLDIQMPRKSGILFYRQMKADPALRDVPVVVITGLRVGYEADLFIRSFLEAEKVPPPQAYLDKPVARQQLLETVGRFVRAA